MFLSHCIYSLHFYPPSNIIDFLIIKSHRILEHDDSLTDRSEGSTLDTSFIATKSLWYDVYNVEYKIPGGMYRGEPPNQYFHEDWVIQAAAARYHACSNHINEEEILPHGVSFAHLIGEVGASSVGKEFNTWMSIDENDAFIPPLPKSTTRGANANPQKHSHVFGNGGK
jgi:hypothetical protein